MSLFFLLIVLVFLLLAAIWWNPNTPAASKRRGYLHIPPMPLVPSSTTNQNAIDRKTTDRDAVLEDEIREIVDVIRQDEADRRRAAALERLASIQASSKKTK